MKMPFLHKQTTVAAPRDLDKLHAVRLAVITVIALMLAGTLAFLYSNFYQTIIQARAVIVLKQEVALENIDLTLWNRVRAIHEYKIAPRESTFIADPFKTVPLPAALPEPNPETALPATPQTP